jgi:hypothetical protein
MNSHRNILGTKDLWSFPEFYLGAMSRNARMARRAPSHCMAIEQTVRHQGRREHHRARRGRQHRLRLAARKKNRIAEIGQFRDNPLGPIFGFLFQGWETS